LGWLRISSILFANPSPKRKAPDISGAFSCLWRQLKLTPAAGGLPSARMSA